MFWMSLKNTVTALGKAYENPMEMKDAQTTTQPHPPSGGSGYGGGAAVVDCTEESDGISALLLETKTTCC